MKTPKPRKLKSGNYNVNLRLNGQNISITRSTAKECTRAAELLKAQYRQEIKPKRVDAVDKTLGQLMDDYIKRHSFRLSPSTRCGYDNIRHNRFQAVIDKQIKSVKDWQLVINDEAKEISPKTLKNAWGFASASMNDAKIPVPDVKLPSVAIKTKPYLIPSEMKQLIVAAETDKYAIPVMLALLGLRRSEICGLTWDDIDFKRKRISVNKARVMDEKHKYIVNDRTKTQRGTRQVPIMIPELYNALCAVPKEDRIGNVVHCNPGTIGKAINRLCVENGLTPIGTHGCRHSFASLGHSVHVPPQEMQMLGGWKDLGTMNKIYTHIGEQEMLNAENAISQFFSKT